MQLDSISAASIWTIFFPPRADTIPKTAPSTAAKTDESDKGSEYKSIMQNVGTLPRINPTRNSCMRFFCDIITEQLDAERKGQAFLVPFDCS